MKTFCTSHEVLPQHYFVTSRFFRFYLAAHAQSLFILPGMCLIKFWSHMLVLISFSVCHYTCHDRCLPKVRPCFSFLWLGVCNEWHNYWFFTYVQSPQVSHQMSLCGSHLIQNSLPCAHFLLHIFTFLWCKD